MKKYFDPAEISLQKLLNTFKLDKLLPWLHYTFKICFPSEKKIIKQLRTVFVLLLHFYQS